MDDTFEVFFAISLPQICEEELTLSGSLLFRPIITLAKLKKIILKDLDDFSQAEEKGVKCHVKN